MPATHLSDIVCTLSQQWTTQLKLLPHSQRIYEEILRYIEKERNNRVLLRHVEIRRRRCSECSNFEHSNASVLPGVRNKRAEKNKEYAN
ncbi:hypothetical protein JTE90_028064 [Oedothorax gibbosus]|uniref:Uncharacterized protein n=1 Tax=Oedothorax gibbosus TaxID=931172 RepID=A0AAV6V8A7_9ARAC|nr:hypothetical protein JTE90_028064 [Oedothorax gibbosus]